ncbi:methionine aminotransferase [Niabella insulamsoli]|uniref:methionine aminotransferase n=1 Tax=Niabella insulamsoli TaxID=3144874 RepID=UPI0031FCC36D
MSLSVKHSASPLNIFTMMTNLARAHDAYNLSQGLPDYPVAAALGAYLTEAVEQGFNQYAPMQGLTSLREAIAIDLNKRYQTKTVAADGVVVTPGATYGIYASLTAIIDKGDEVIYFEPAFDCYRPAIEITGGVPVRITLEASADFRIDWNQVKDRITLKTKAILINTPHNPTGYVWAQFDWDQLADVIGDKDIYVIADEVYDHIVFDDRQHLPGFLQPRLRHKLISIYSFGKAFHITGWKVGYCVAAPDIVAAFKSIHQYLTFSVNTPAQHAIAQYLQHYDVAEAAATLQHKRDLLIGGLQSSRFQPLTTSAGTYFQLYDYSAISDRDDVSFAKWMTAEHQVATIPLSAFYQSERSDKIVRLCFAKKDDVLLAAAAQLSKV